MSMLPSPKNTISHPLLVLDEETEVEGPFKHDQNQQLDRRKLSLNDCTTTMLSSSQQSDSEDGFQREKNSESNNRSDYSDDDEWYDSNDDINSELSSRSGKDESSIEVQMGSSGSSRRLVGRSESSSRNIRQNVLERLQSQQSLPTLRHLMFDNSMLKSMDGKREDWKNRTNFSNPNNSITYFDAMESLDSPDALSDRINCDVINDKNFKDLMEDEYEEGLRRQNSDKSGKKKRVRFVDEGGSDLIGLDANEVFMKQQKEETSLIKALDIFHDQPGSGLFDNSNNGSKNFFQALYDDDNSDAMSSSEYSLGEDECEDAPESQVFKNMLYSIAGIALSSGVGAAKKLISAVQNSSDADPNTGISEIMGQQGQVSEMAADIAHASELAADSSQMLNTSSYYSLNSSSSALNTSSSALNTSSASSSSASACSGVCIY